jgi:hypothetical protein
MDMARAPIRFRKPTDLNKALVFPALLLIFACVPQGASAQVYGTDSHNVTVTVATVNIVQVSAGTASLTLSAAAVTAGVNLMGPVTNSATSLLWGFNSSLRKVTVKTNLAAPKFILKVLAVAPTQGTASPEVTLSTTAADFLINTGRSSGSCTIQYSGCALASAGTGTDTHTITFTVAAQ